MNKTHGVTVENLLRSLPGILTQDKKTAAFVRLIAEELERMDDESGRGRLYTDIDALPERVLDILAYDFKVDWWDTEYTPEEKRATLKGAWKVHRLLGTKEAVETAVSAIYPGSRVAEWFEYGGEPYHFKLEIRVGGESKTLEQQENVLRRVYYYKNLRSHLEDVTYTTPMNAQAMLRMGGSMGTMVTTPIAQAPE